MNASIFVSLVPMCDELGYQSESYAAVDVIIDSTDYCFPNLVLLENKVDGRVTSIDVYQNVDDVSMRFPDRGEYIGTCPLGNWRDEGEYLLALGKWLVNDAADAYCDIC